MRNILAPWFVIIAVLIPLMASGQSPGVPTIGFLNIASPDVFAARVNAFRKGLNETGFVEGRNVVIEFRWAHGDFGKLPVLADDLVRREVSVIASTGGLSTARAAKAATTTIPIVFQVGVDPVASGLVGSLSRPGGNLTGITGLNVELGPKRLELLRELVPDSASIAFLSNPANPFVETARREFQMAANKVNLPAHLLSAGTDDEIDLAFAQVISLRATALVISPDPFFNTRMDRLAALGLHHNLPTIYQYREFTEAGGLMSYGSSFTEPYYLVGVYAGRVLKGEKPADLAVQQSTKVELAVNLRTAKTIGVDVPTSLLLRADEIIE